MKRMITQRIILFSVSLFSLNAFAQDDWQKMMNEGTPTKKEKTLATFKTTRIINSQSIETVKKRTLDFRVTHKFGPIGTSAGGPHNLYGLDNSSDIRIAFEYGINDRLTVGFGRSKQHEALQGLVKYRLLQQTTDNSTPLSVTLYGDASFSPEKDIDGRYNDSIWGSKTTAHRLNYTAEMVIGRKFSPSISFQLMPLFVHRNYVPDYQDENDLFSLGAGGRIKFSKRFAFIFDYYYTFSNYRNSSTSGYQSPLGVGFEIETGGHVFSIMYTNAASIIESQYISSTTDSWADGGIHFCFNISRNFRL